MADQGLNGGGPVEVGPGPGEDPPRKRLRHEDHETQMAAQHIAHGLPHYAAAYGAAPYEGALEHLLREGDHSEAHAQAVAQVQAQLQAAHQDQMQQQHQQAQAGQPNVSEGVPVQQNPATPGVDPPGFTYRNRARRKASEKPVGSSQIRQSFSKRKRGIAQKAYQLFKITDAKVFLFCANDKGASWAYATPGFGASLAPAHLKLLRQMANPDIDDASKDGETTNTMIMAHPPGAENDPDDRDQYVQDNGYAEDADGNIIGDAEGGQVPEGWATHDGTMQALQSAAAAAAQMSSEHQAHGGYEQVPPVTIGQEMHHHNGENLHFIADAAANAGYSLGEHQEHAAQQVVHGQDASQHQHPHLDQQTGDYAGATVLGAPMEAPANGEPAFGVPSHIQTHGDGKGHR
ncbi:probable serum response factor homolog B at N-terminal half [Coccomyxa sp. Obi]|nr:probable serum response factor homolog B at N-terminal half [Coccomyxa sp. Obi]